MKSNLNKKILLSTIMITALIVGSMQLTVFAVGNGVTPLGLEIAGKTDEFMSGLQTDIENFITEKQLIIAETQEERLSIIENKKEELRTVIEETNAERQTLIAQLEAGDITEEEFAAEMKKLATNIANQAKIMQQLGGILGGMGKELGEALRTHAQSLIDDVSEAGNEIEAIGLSIATQMSGLDLPIPENIPNIPDEIPPIELPSQVPQIPGPP